MRLLARLGKYGIAGNSGFSLVEQIVSIGITSIAVVVAIEMTSVAFNASSKLEKATVNHAGFRSIEQTLRGVCRNALGGQTFFNGNLANDLGVGWLELNDSSAMGSLQFTNRTLLGLDTTETDDDGVSSALTPDFQLAVILGRDPSAEILRVTDNPDRADKLYAFDEDCSTCQISVSGDLSAYSVGDIIALTAPQGNMLVRITQITGDKLRFAAEESFNVGLITTKLPISMMLPGATVVKVQPIVFGYDSNAKRIALTAVNRDGGFRTLEVLDINMSKLKFDNWRGGPATTDIYLPLMKRVFLLATVSRRTYAGQDFNFDWTFAF